MSSLTRSDDISELRISSSNRDMMARNGTTKIGDLDDVSRSDLEAAGMSSLEVDDLNAQLEGHGFNPVL